VSTAELEALAARLRESGAFRGKRDIARVAARVEDAPRAVSAWAEGKNRVALGDDTAAIPDGDGYLLFAAEGMLPDFLDRDPYFAGWSSVMVNVSDVAAMGGYPLAVVDVYFHAPSSQVDAVLEGIRGASAAYGVPLVGGHTTRHEGGPHALAVAILGRARRLMTSHGATPGDVVLAAVDLRGGYRGDWPFWNATTGRSASDLRANLAVLGRLADAELVHACKDVSNAGVAGTLLMMAEASGVGARLDVDRLPIPEGIDLDRWLLTFPSYGFLFAVPPRHAGTVQAVLRAEGVACEDVGGIDDSRTLRLARGRDEALLWDLRTTPFTGFSLPGRGDHREPALERTAAR
jgi:AIR synthase-related protein